MPKAAVTRTLRDSVDYFDRKPIVNDTDACSGNSDRQVIKSFIVEVTINGGSSQRGRNQQRRKAESLLP